MEGSGDSLPPFEPNGALPPGSVYGSVDGKDICHGWNTSLDEVEARFVTRFADSANRPVLYKELTHFIRFMQQYVACVTAYVGGAFVTDTTEPTDIVIALEVRAGELTHIEALDFWIISRMLDGREAAITDSDLHVYTELVEWYPEGHPRHQEAEANRTKVMYLMSEPVAGIHGGHLDIWDCRADALDEVRT